MDSVNTQYALIPRVLFESIRRRNSLGDKEQVMLLLIITVAMFVFGALRFSFVFLFSACVCVPVVAAVVCTSLASLLSSCATLSRCMYSFLSFSVSVRISFAAFSFPCCSGSVCLLVSSCFLVSLCASVCPSGNHGLFLWPSMQVVLQYRRQ